MQEGANEANETTGKTLERNAGICVRRANEYIT